MDPQDTSAGTSPFPSVEDLDRLPAEACQAELTPLFEGAPRFVKRLVEARPFGNDMGLIGAAYQLAREVPDDEAVELVNAHPRIGGDRRAMSRTSQREQGYETEDDEVDEGAEPAWVDEELAGLNEVYEGRFGFRYVVFVAGRPRAEIIPLVEMSLRNDREAELRRAVSECVAIAEDRLRNLRAAGSASTGQPELAEPAE